MKSEIIKWQELYKVYLKDWEEKVISSEIYENIKQDLFDNKWIEINKELFNPFEIKKITKFKVQDWIKERLSIEPENIQKKVREYIRTYKKELTLWVLENMILKAKWKLQP